MKYLHSVLNRCVLLGAVLLVTLAVASAQTSTAQTPTRTRQTPSAAKPIGTGASKSYPPAQVESGKALFLRDCSFCHGRDADGGETGPDLTRSKLVTADVGGDKIGAVVRNGRPGKNMPPFNYSGQQIASLMAFIHTQRNNALRNKGGRKGVDVADLQTGNAEAGKQYFNGAGRCSTCHSPTGDLAGVASRFEGLNLEEQMLYPSHAKSSVTVIPASGQTITGTLDYLDEFTVGLIDSTGVYHSWRTSDVQYKVDAPVNAHVEQFSKYTDADIHNLMAYLQTLR